MYALVAYEDSLHACGLPYGIASRADLHFRIDDDQCPGCRALNVARTTRENELKSEVGEDGLDAAMAGRMFRIVSWRESTPEEVAG